MSEIRITVKTASGRKMHEKKLHKIFAAEFLTQESLYYLDNEHDTFMVMTDQLQFVQKNFDTNSGAFKRFAEVVQAAARTLDVECVVNDGAPLCVKAQVAAALPCAVSSNSTGMIQNTYFAGLAVEYVEDEENIAAKAPTRELLCDLLEGLGEVCALIRDVPADYFTPTMVTGALRIASRTTTSGDCLAVIGPPVASGYCCFIRKTGTASKASNNTTVQVISEVVE